MSIECPVCKHSGKITREFPPEQDFMATCPKCKERFAVRLNVRSAYRKNISISAFYRFQGIECPTRKGTVLDISRGGLCIQCIKRVPVHEELGNIMQLSFTLPPKDETIKADGEIVRIVSQTEKTITLGLKFKGLRVYEDAQIGFFLMA
jgi:c-di-GMP-binding flagellar brake protein YcgR